MSFILDALKKSESDRQRQSGPALFEVKMPPPRRTLPAWALAIGALLLVNLVIVAWMLLRHPAHGGEGAAPEGQASSPAAARGSPAPSPAAPAAPLPAPLSVAPPPAAPLSASAAASAPPAAPLASPPLTSPALTAPAAGGDNPDDYAPAADPAAAGFGSRVRRATADGVPLYQDAAATPGTNLPQLRLDLHVFAAHPQERFVMINMHKLHEGDTLPEGVHVDSITPEGAVLSYNGSRFLLPRD